MVGNNVTDTAGLVSQDRVLQGQHEGVTLLNRSLGSAGDIDNSDLESTRKSSLTSCRSRAGRTTDLGKGVGSSREGDGSDGGTHYY